MKTAMITGCNRGLGKTLLKMFAANGYNIIACTRTAKDEFLDKCRALEQENGISIKHICFDFAIHEQVQKGMEEISAMDVEIDVLVNNVGINDIVKPLMYLEYEDLQKTFMVNYFSTVMLTKEVAMNMMRQSHGSIINISSMMAEGHQPCGACYDASKAALNMFTRSAAQELAPLGIRVNAVACGIMNSGMADNLNEKAHKKILKTVAMKREAETTEIAEMVLFLASDKASYMTGEIVNVNGGAII